MGSINCEPTLSLCHDEYRSVKVLGINVVAFACESTCSYCCCLREIMRKILGQEPLIDVKEGT